jgi:hypothetical protein
VGIVLALLVAAVALTNVGGLRQRLFGGPDTGTIRSLAVLPLEISHTIPSRITSPMA